MSGIILGFLKLWAIVSILVGIAAGIAAIFGKINEVWLCVFLMLAGIGVVILAYV